MTSYFEKVVFLTRVQVNVEVDIHLQMSRPCWLRMKRVLADREGSPRPGTYSSCPASESLSLERQILLCQSRGKSNRHSVNMSSNNTWLRLYYSLSSSMGVKNINKCKTRLIKGRSIWMYLRLRRCELQIPVDLLLLLLLFLN